MTLPDLIDYATPRHTPTNRVNWTLEAGRAAVLVHDLQRYFLRAFAPGCPALERALSATAEILAAARAAGVPVFYTAQTGDQPADERGLQGELWGRGMTSAVEDTAIADAVAPQDGDVVIVKHRYSAFARSDLADRLAALGRDQLVVVGVYAHIGVAATASDAFQREVYPFVVADGVADFGAADHERALAQVASCSGVVLRAAEVVDAFARAAEPVEGGAWDAELRSALDGLLTDDALAAAFAAPESDIFALGLDSVRAFELLDRLLDAGADVDFGEFTRRPTVSYLREQGLLLTQP
ncbi:MAG TPA: isochorismatase family protein [Arachnia sp.]|nr:isochorismatase family protein [Arachnia sp.]